jgi:thioredoxin reductase (NADPH)
MKKIVIIGHGPAGISAAIYLKRAGYDPIVIGKGYGSFSYDNIQIENYYGFSTPIKGKDLVDQGLAQAKRLGVRIIYDAVLDLVDLGTNFIVKTEKQSYEASAILLATGKKRLTLNIPGFKKYRGKGISFCATCDGYFYRKKKLALIGCGPYMQQELKDLENLSDDITIFTNGKTLQSDVNHLVVTSKIKAFDGDSKISSIKTDDQTYPIDGVFVAIGTPSSLDFAEKLGVIVESNNIYVDKDYQTNVEGLFAAGDVIGGKLQIAKAVYDGMMVSDSIQKYLKTKV